MNVWEARTAQGELEDGANARIIFDNDYFVHRSYIIPYFRLGLYEENEKSLCEGQERGSAEGG